MLHDPACLERLLLALSVNVSAMFRDPRFFLAFRQHAVPLLRTYPFIRIWQAGCSTGEEVYSLAILLQEEGLYDRCRIYATDMNEVVLQKARDGIYPLDVMQKYTANYQAAGGTGAFSDYYTAAYDHVILRAVAARPTSSSRSTTSSSDGVVQRVQRDPVPQRDDLFHAALQERVHDLFARSFATFGAARARVARVAAVPAERARVRAARRRARSCSGGCTDGLRARRHRRVARRARRRVDGAGRAAAGFRCRSSIVQHRGRGAARRAICPAIWQRAHGADRRDAEDKAPIAARARLPRAGGLSPAHRSAATCSRCRPKRRCSGRARRSTCCSRRRRRRTATALIGVMLTGASADGSQGLQRDPRARRLRAGPGSGDGRVRRDAAAPHSPRRRSTTCSASTELGRVLGALAQPVDAAAR